MRLKILIWLVVLLGLGVVDAAAQSNRIAIDPGQRTIEEVIDHIERNSDYIFFYNTDLPDLSAKVEITRPRDTIENLLRLITRGRNIEYSIVGRQIVLYKTQRTKPQGTDEPTLAIQGTVTDLAGNPVIGANIIERGTGNGTVSDLDGHFRISVLSPALLQISYVGYVMQEIQIVDDRPLLICMQEDAYLLNELVVIGYGTMQRKMITSAISSLSGNDILKGTASSTVAASLIGKITGLILHETSSAHAEATLQLRGVGSVNAEREPLVVVDGMPGADIRSVLPEDIETIDVLKDASAGAIYGSRATNGVLLITTKSSNITDGLVKLNYSGEAVLKQATNKPRMLTAEEYVAYNRGTNYGDAVDWWDESLNDEKWSQRHVFSLQSGVRNSQIYASMSYENMKGLKKFEESSRYSGRVNGNFRLMDDWLEIKAHVVRNKDWQYSTQIGFSSLTQQVKSLWGDQSYFEEAGFPSPGTPGNAIRIEEGVKIGQFHLWKFAGFDAEGNWLLYNKEGEVIPASQKKNEDKQHIGNYYPKLTVNWNHSLTYKNFDLSMTLLSYIDFDIYNAVDMYYGISSVSNLNVLKKAYTDYAHIKGEKELCDFFLQDGTFLKIQNIYLGYTYDLKKHSRLLDKIRFYLSVNNVYTFTRYSGSDPSTINITGLDTGIDWHNDINPMARTFSFGVNITL